MKASMKKLLQVPVVCVLFFVAGFLSLLLLVWMAVVSVGLMVRKAVLTALDRLGGGKSTAGKTGSLH
jgi:hypothetical protein